MLKKNIRLSGTKTALITGASAGIGQAFADQLAALGINLVLIARRAERLHEIAQRLEKKFAIKTYVLPYDLSKPHAPQQIFAELQQHKLQIDLLINNAGYLDYQDFTSLDWQSHNALLQTMLTSVTELCYLYCRNLQQRRVNTLQEYKPQGAIINTASVAGLINQSGKSREKKMLLYGSIKSFVVSFSLRLQQAYKGDGLYCQALCPGLTYSEFHLRTNQAQLYTKLPKFLWQSAEDVVTNSLRKLAARRKSLVTTGWINIVFVIIYHIMHIFCV